MARTQHIFKFDSEEEQSAFVHLLNKIPLRESWDDVKIFNHQELSCHVCKSTDLVKKGILPVDYFFEKESKKSYVFWQLCERCHQKDWVIPSAFYPNRSLKYEGFDANRKVEISEIKIFNHPSIVLLNTDSVIISV